MPANVGKDATRVWLGHCSCSCILQCTFLNNVQSFTEVVTGMGNPFLATGHELIRLDKGAVMDDAVAVSLSKNPRNWSSPSQRIREFPARQGNCTTVRHNQEKQHVHIRQQT